LLRYLSKVRGYTVEETSPGIYQVSGDYVPIQVIESKKLSANENLWLKSLTNDLEVCDRDAILEESWKHRLNEKMDAYLDVIFRANPKAFLEVHKMRTATFEEVFTEAGIIPEWLERGRVQGLEQGIEQGTERGKKIIARNLLKMGMPIAEIAQATELPVEKIMQLSNE
jgi:flagellar biosynthesis/type III secretory pathway protein FliH